MIRKKDRWFKGVVKSFVTSEVTEDNKSKETKDCQSVRCIAVTAADKRRHDKSGRFRHTQTQCLISMFCPAS